MDPNETLAYVLKKVQKILNSDLTTEELVDDAWNLAEAISDLDAWMQKGGFLPERWIN